MLNHEEDQFVDLAREISIAFLTVSQVSISMRVIDHVQVELDDVVENDSPLLVDGVVLDPVLLFGLQSLLHLNLLSRPSLNIDH